LRFRRSAGSRWAWWLNVVRRSAAAFPDGHSWRVLAWTLLRFVIGPLGFVFVAVEVLLPLVLVAAPLVVVGAGSRRSGTGPGCSAGWQRRVPPTTAVSPSA
jgi:hypothetical protein